MNDIFVFTMQHGGCSATVALSGYLVSSADKELAFHIWRQLFVELHKQEQKHKEA